MLIRNQWLTWIRLVEKIGFKKSNDVVPDSNAYPSFCGSLLILNKDGTASCPNGCGTTKPPICCSKQMIVFQSRNSYKIVASTDTIKSDSSVSPVVDCGTCGFAVDGVKCYSCSNDGTNLPRNGFFERCFCAYVWTCKNGCSRSNRGGCFHNGTLNCKKCDSRLETSRYVKIHGEPSN